MTLEGMAADYWAHHYFDNPNAGKEEFDDPDYEESVRRLLGDSDDWEEL